MIGGAAPLRAPGRGILLVAIRAIILGTRKWRGCPSPGSKCCDTRGLWKLMEVGQQGSHDGLHATRRRDASFDGVQCIESCVREERARHRGGAGLSEPGQGIASRHELEQSPRAAPLTVCLAFGSWLKWPSLAARRGAPAGNTPAIRTQRQAVTRLQPEPPPRPRSLRLRDLTTRRGNPHSSGAVPVRYLCGGSKPVELQPSQFEEVSQN